MKRSYIFIPHPAYLACLKELIALSCSTSQDKKLPVLTGPYLGQTVPGIIPEFFATEIIATKDEIFKSGKLKDLFKFAGTPQNDNYEIYWVSSDIIQQMRKVK